jgi:Icc-related predicted phosphoesterase
MPIVPERSSTPPGPRALARPGTDAMAKRTRVYFATDLHGSSKCFRKFLNAGPTYGADVLVLGADLGGKAIQGIVHGAGGHWRARFVGTDHDVADGAELEALERLIEDHGYYPYRAEPGELEARQAAGTLDALFVELMRARLEAWMALADERLRPRGIPIYVMLGNDDPPELKAVLEAATWATHVEGKVVALDEDHELISWGYSNLTPFDSHREQTESELAESIEGMVGRLRDPGRAVFNLHVPPIASGLDDAPVLDASLTVQQSLGQVRFAPAGSTAVRSAIEASQPLLSLHGHIHESAAIRRIGRTIAINPGSDYATGALNGALVSLERDKVATHQLVRG